MRRFVSDQQQNELLSLVYYVITATVFKRVFISVVAALCMGWGLSPKLGRLAPTVKHTG